MIELTRLRTACRDLWLIAKQAWYVPFIWALAWFSFWIFRDFVVLNYALAQGNPSNYVGAAISITALLAAGIVSAKSRKKALLENSSSAEENTIETHEFLVAHDEGAREKQPKPFVRRQSPIETSQVQNLYDRTSKLGQTQTNPPALPGQDEHFGQIQRSRDASSDCLVCPSLLTCNHRKNRSIESATPCPYAKETKSLF